MQRIIDANVNRLAEGLRVLEDIARFVLADESLSRGLKSLRHQVRRTFQILDMSLISSRDVSGDIGARADDPAGIVHHDTAALVAANACRAQEALRVLEEAARLPEMKDLPRDIYRQARFALYDMESKMMSLLWRKEKRRAIHGLYVIIDIEQLRGRSEVEVGRQVISGGAEVIQLRDKMRPKGDTEKSALAIQAVCAERGVPFIVNDHVDIAVAVGADGVHLGQEDLSVASARTQLPIDKIIGCSTKTVEQARRAVVDGADYVAVGAIYPTRTKVKTVLVGIERLRRIKEIVSLPVVAIGGIGEDTVAEVVSAGADAIAVIGSVLASDDIEAATRRLANVFQLAHSGGGSDGTATG